MSETIGSRGWRIWKEKSLPQEVVPLSDAEGVVDKLEAENAALKRENEKFRKGLSEDAIVAFVNRNGGREIHRSWRDAMLWQDRKVKPELMVWEDLPIYDQVLDRKISLDALLDYSTWVLGKVALLTAEQ